MSKVSQLLNRKYQSKIKRLHGVVQSQPRDAAGKSLGYVLCEIAGNSSVPVSIGPNDVYYQGDSIAVETTGTPSAANFRSAGLTSYNRPDSGALEFSTTTTIGNQKYEPGDMVWGNPFESHFWFSITEGAIFMRVGGQTNGVIRGNGTIDLGDPNHVHMHLFDTGIEWKAGDTILSAIDAEGRSIYGFERLGRPHGPCIEWRETTDDNAEKRFTFQGLGMNGVPWFSFISGTDTTPDDYRFYIGPVGATHRLVYENGNLTLTGQIEATSGEIGGWTISNTYIQGGAARLYAAGYLQLGSGDDVITLHSSDATWRLAIGANTMSSAPFRVDKDGNVYAASFKQLTANNNLGAYIIDVNNNNTGTGIGAIRGTGEDIGVYGTANTYGVEGYVSGGHGAGVYGYSPGGNGVKGQGTTGVVATMVGGGDEALLIVDGPLNVNSENITNVNRIYFSATQYLYLSGSDIYWYNGATGTKLN